jgi:hypothetical protein
MEGYEKEEDRSKWVKILPLTRENGGGDDGTRTHDPLLANECQGPQAGNTHPHDLVISRAVGAFGWR